MRQPTKEVVRTNRRREAVDAVLSVFSARQAETKEAMSNATKGLEAAQAKTKREMPSLSVSVSLDAAAPRIVVPVSSTRDIGFVLLDMGHMVVEGGSVGGWGIAHMTYKAELSDVNVRQPAKKSLLLARQSMDVVIQPFKINMDAAVGGGVTKPGMAFAVEVMPGVEGVMSPDRIYGLHQAWDYVTKADLRGEGSAGEPPLGLAGPNTASWGGGTGVQRLGGEDRIVAIELDNSVGGGAQHEPLVLIELHMKLPTIGLVLVEADADAANESNGLLLEAAGKLGSVTIVSRT